MSDTTNVLVNGRLAGLEKEGLRVTPDGQIAQSDHPEALGAALTHPYITTDFSEALLEVVTPPMGSTTEALLCLDSIHRFIHQQLPDNEMIWGSSMPCILGGEQRIRIGDYGSSNAGQMKTIYRRGLGLRYGKSMQAIAGIHFNYSLPKPFWPVWRAIKAADTNLSETAFVTDQYFHITRNLLRYGWLVPYLFGSSPAVCQCFLDGAAPLPSMKSYRGDTWYEPYGTSLRMGNIGYQYRTESPVYVDYNDPDTYVQNLLALISSPYPEYEALGLTNADGDYQQLNTHRLQIENEYYSSVRPKQVPEGNEMPVLAMARRGIRYLELRSTDVNPFESVGISSEQLLFLEILMVFGLLQDDIKLNRDDLLRVSENMAITAHKGREPDVTLLRSGPDSGKRVTLKDWGTEILDQMTGVAELLDRQTATTGYSESLKVQQAKMHDPEQTPSARVLREMTENFSSFAEFALTRSRDNHQALTQTQAAMAGGYDTASLHELASVSLRQKAALERQDEPPLDQWLAQYFSQLGAAELKRFQ